MQTCYLYHIIIILKMVMLKQFTNTSILQNSVPHYQHNLSATVI